MLGDDENVERFFSLRNLSSLLDTALAVATQSTRVTTVATDSTLLLPEIDMSNI
jgi:hypothetical protein